MRDAHAQLHGCAHPPHRARARDGPASARRRAGSTWSAATCATRDAPSRRRRRRGSRDRHRVAPVHLLVAAAASSTRSASWMKELLERRAGMPRSRARRRAVLCLWSRRCGPPTQAPRSSPETLVTTADLFAAVRRRASAQPWRSRRRDSREINARRARLADAVALARARPRALPGAPVGRGARPDRARPALQWLRADWTRRTESSTALVAAAEAGGDPFAQTVAPPPSRAPAALSRATRMRAARGFRRHAHLDAAATTTKASRTRSRVCARSPRCAATSRRRARWPARPTTTRQRDHDVRRRAVRLPHRYLDLERARRRPANAARSRSGCTRRWSARRGHVGATRPPSSRWRTSTQDG